ncbi:MAG: ATP-binding cassette domain-containing protein [Deinococcales bacterium]
MSMPNREDLKGHVTVRTDPITAQDALIDIQDLDLWYGHFQALYHNSVTIAKHQVTALIGASGCGKSTLLRCINRMNDLVPSVRIEGKLFMMGSIFMQIP